MELTEKQQEILKKVEQKETEDMLIRRCKDAGICHKCGEELKSIPKLYITERLNESLIITGRPDSFIRQPHLDYGYPPLCSNCDAKKISEIELENNEVQNEFKLATKSSKEAIDKYVKNYADKPNEPEEDTPSAIHCVLWLLLIIGLGIGALIF